MKCSVFIATSADGYIANLGSDKLLFGFIGHQIKLKHAQAKVVANDFVQVQYDVDYS
ncbi:MAG: hypothetical protein VX829_03510 [Pseudomonadota bacterium]|uniref:hypothetical protein n=1 Tax=Methylophaga aminisulfidivorans TaxID=230105 RepID=UPI0024E23327|nr:hypothetical protein [Methylophaga aminisulfidivorans]MEC9411728.1 hypothetical protein [Pseudomonadota bacterium]